MFGQTNTALNKFALSSQYYCLPGSSACIMRGGSEQGFVRGIHAQCPSRFRYTLESVKIYHKCFSDISFNVMLYLS